jgi:hypothetical protein
MVPAQLRSASFVLRNNRLIIPVVGFPNSEDAGIYLESETNHQRFWIRGGGAHLEWQPFTLSLPKSLINTPVRLIAFSKSTKAYVGVGTPYFRTNRAFPGLAFSKIVSPVFLSVAYLLLLFFPPFYWLNRFKTFAPTERLLACFVLTSVLSLPLFFLAFYFPSVGRFFAHLWLLLSSLLLCKTAVTRTLHPGGAHLFTTPLVRKNEPTRFCASLAPDGTVVHLVEPPEYHGNPISSEGSLVTVNWGYDITNFIFESSGLFTEIVFLDILDYGIRAEYIEVLITRKFPRKNSHLA